MKQKLDDCSNLLPSGWKVDSFTEVEEFFLKESLRKHVSMINDNVDSLLGEILNAMHRSAGGSGSDGQLFNAISNLALHVIEFGTNFPNIGSRLAQFAPQILSKTVQALNDKSKKHWKDKLLASEMVYWLAKSGCCDATLDAKYTIITNALKSSKADVVKKVRDSAALALEELDRVKDEAGEGRKKSKLAAVTSGGEANDNLDGVDFHESSEPPPLKFEPDYEPELPGDGESEDDGEEERDEDDDDDDSVAGPLKSRLSRLKTEGRGSEEFADGDKAASKPKKKKKGRGGNKVLLCSEDERAGVQKGRKRKFWNRE